MPPFLSSSHLDRPHRQLLSFAIAVGPAGPLLISGRSAAVGLSQARPVFSAAVVE